jgi:hypothetical protein
MGMISGGGDASTVVAIPSRLQVFLSRGFFGWPLYSIILAFGQVGFPFFARPGCAVLIDHFTDVERDQLPDSLTFWF